MTVRMQMAQLLVETDGVAEAISIYLKITVDKDYPTPLRAELTARVGTLYEKAGKKTDAIGQFKAALALDPQNLEAKQGLMRLEGK